MQEKMQNLRKNCIFNDTALCAYDTPNGYDGQSPNDN